MKKVILILSVLFSFLASYGQVPIGCPTCTTEIKGILKVDSLFLLPLRNDTLINPGRPGAIVVAYGKTWLYTGTQWSVLVGAAWGNMPGNITNQTDLMALLNGKQDSIGNGYGWKKVAGKGVFDSAVVRKVDTIGKVNDSTIFFKINGQTFTLVIRGSASGSVVTSISLITPSSVFFSPVSLVNTAGAWSGTIALQNQNPNVVWAGPGLGGPGQPAFRNLIVPDLPTGIPPSYIMASAVNFWNGKVDSTGLSNDTIYEWRNGIRYFRYLISGVSGGMNQLTGEVIAGPGTGSQAAKLNRINNNTGTFGNASNVAQVILDSTGRASAAAAIPIQIAESQVTGLPTDLAAKLNTSDTANKWVQAIKRSGDSVYYQKNGTWIFAFLDSLGSGGSGNTNSNVGAGFRLAIPSTNNIKTIRGINGLLYDSTTNANEITGQVDSSKYLPVHRLADSAAVLRALIGSGGVSPANPTGTVGYAPVNGVAATYMRSDAAPKVDTSLSTGVAPRHIVADTAAALRAALGGIDTTIFRATGVTGQVPFYLSILGNTYTLSFPKFRDTSSGSIGRAPDSALTIPTHDSTSTNALATRYDVDTMRARIGAGGSGITDTTALVRKGNNLSDLTNADSARKNIAALGNKKILGTLYNANSWTTGDLTTTFTYTGAGGDISVVGGKIQLTNGNQTIVSGNNSAYNRVLKLTGGYGGTLLPYVKIVVKYKVTSALSSSSSGIASGQYSTSTLGSLSSMMAYVNTTTTGSQVLSFVGGTANTSTAPSASSLIVNQNDYILETTERRLDRVYVTAKNLTTDSGAVSSIFVYNGTNASSLNTPNTGVFGWANLGGTVIIDSINITSESPYNANVYYGVDSKGFYTTPQDMSTGSLMNDYFPGTLISSGPSDVSADLNNRIGEILRIKPKQILIASFPRNDVAFGLSTAAWKQNLRTFDSTMTANGIPVIWTDGVYETQQAALLFNVAGYLDSAYAPRVIKTFRIGNVAGTVANDIIHPSIFGSQLFTQTVYNSGKVLQYADYLNSHYKSDDRLHNTYLDSLSIGGSIHMDFGAYHPASMGQYDIGMREGGALRWAFGTNAQQVSIRQSTSNAALIFQNDLGGTSLVNAPAFQFKGTAGGTLGAVNDVLVIDEDGQVRNINVAGGRPTVLARWIGYQTYFNHGYFGGVGTNTDSTLAGYIPMDSVGNSLLWNPSPTNSIKIMVSGGTHGGMVQAMRAYPTKKIELSDTLFTPKWPNKSSLLSTDSLDAIDATGVHYKIPSTLFDGGSGIVRNVNGVDGTGLTSYQTISTYAVPADGVFEVGAYLLVNSIATNQIKITINFTDHTNVGRTIDMYPPGVSGSLATLTGYYAYWPMTIKAKSGTNIVVATDGIGGGSINYDCGTTVKKIR